MQDHLAAQERLRKDAADATLIRTSLRTKPSKTSSTDCTVTWISQRIDQLADEIERAMNKPKTE
ncbi:hypothetical protein [Bradyrhizobium sp. URHC0002]